MEKLALIVIAAVAVVALARIVWRAVRAPRGQAGACCGCPLASDCGSTQTRSANGEPRLPGSTTSQCSEPTQHGTGRTHTPDGGAA